MTERELYELLRAAGAPEVAFAYQNAPRPKPPYVLVEEVATSWVREIWCPDENRRYGEFAVRCRIQWHGPQAMAKLSLLKAKTPGLRWSGDVQRIPASLEDVRWEDRATCDAAFHTHEPLNEPGGDGIIDAVSTTPTVDERTWSAFTSRRP